MPPAVKSEHEATATILDFKDFNDFRPLLDAVDRVRSMRVTDEGISLPTIVVVGDQSHGKSSVLESLARVDLPRGDGTVTRVPLVLRLENSSKHGGCSEVCIQYGDKDEFQIRECEISRSIQAATVELAGEGKDIVNRPIALHIKKPDAPDLTMVDLPGITRVPVDGQPENILEQITNMYMEYITPEDSIILNVVQASVDFSTCESIRLSRLVDKGGERTLVVVTKVDKSPENLYDKVIAAAASIGLGYICVRNRTLSDTTYAEARAIESELFRTHSELKKFPKEMAGIPSLAKQLTHIQAESIRKSLPKLLKKIEAELRTKRKELNLMPRRAVDESSASATYLGACRAFRRSFDSLAKGNFIEFPTDKDLHFSARSYEHFRRFSEQLVSNLLNSNDTSAIEERLREAMGVSLPNFLEYNVFRQLIAVEVDGISAPCLKLVSDIYDYTARVTSSLIHKYTDGYPKLRAGFKKTMQEVLSASKNASEEFVNRKLYKERTIVYTYNDEYLKIVNSLQNAANKVTSPEKAVRDMSINLASYWKVVQGRLTDEIPLELRYAIQELAIEQWETKVCQADNQAMLKMLAEDPQMGLKRSRLLQSIKTLESAYDILRGDF